jgi:S-DNA-T family DNA segregation ATPase FtsK/SpoIIIE
MASRSKKNETESSPSLKKETVETVVAILFILLAVFLLMAAGDKAGLVGQKVFAVLDYLFGIGYYLLPLVLIALGVTFLRSLKHSMTTVRMVGGGVFLLAGLGLVDLAMDRGGLIGSLVANPMVKLFDGIATAILLAGLLLISTLIVLDMPLRLDALFAKLWAFLMKPTATEAAAESMPDLRMVGDVEDDEPEPVSKKQKQQDQDDEEDEPTPRPAPAPRKAEEVMEPAFPQAPVRLSLTPYEPPPMSLLERDNGKPAAGDIKANANIIKRTLQNFGINVEMDEVSIGPSVTRYALKPAEGVKLSRIVALQNDLALALAAHPLRIEAPIPGKSLVGIEIPNSKKTTVGLGTLLSAPEFSGSDKPLLMAMGKGISGATTFANLAKAPHLLVAGTTGSGKSVTIHALVTSLLYRNSPQAMKFIMIDPKRVELTLYNKIPHLLTPVITDAKKAILSLKWAAKEMDRRYDILQSHSARDIGSYHKNIVAPALEMATKAKGDVNALEMPDPMPYIVIIIDELADIMQTYPKELEAGIVRLAQMSRAVGIHLILSTQRPSVNVITGLIKANIPSRVALQVSSSIDSRTILDQTGAEKLLGAGDMLYLSGDMSTPIRVQSAFISETEVKNVVDHLIKAHMDDVPNEINLDGAETRNALFDAVAGANFDEEDDDDLYEEARVTVVQAGKASTSFLQRKLRIGYARAARLMDILEERGVIGAGDGAKPREVLGGGSDAEYGRDESDR